MTKSVRARYPGLLVLSLALTGLFGGAPAAEAQSRDRRDRISNDSYEQMRRFARELDRLAARANREAQADQAGYRGFRRDGNFLRSIDNFARRVRQFRTRMDSYRTQPWRVDDDVERLMRDARTVQNRIERARFVDASTRRDWNQVIYLLDRVRNEYRFATEGYGRYDRDPRYDDRYPGDARYPDDYRTGGYENGYGYGSTDLRQLAYDLERRAARASDLAARSTYGRYDDADDLREFSAQARAFRARVEQNRMTRSQLRSEVNELLEDAQDAYDDLRRANISRELSAEWEGVVRILNEMRRIAIS